MSKGKSSLRKIDRTAFNHANNQKKVIIGPQRITQSLLDVMADGREFESLLQYKPSPDMNIANEIRRSIAEIESIRQRPLICYMANIVNPRIIASKSIDNNDDLPFSEMVDVVLPDSKEVDIVLVTPGGSGQQVAKFVDRLRPRFDKVSFILPNMAMSAGTIFAMSGDEIIMDPRSYIGPIDPQIPNKDGNFMPAQAILTLIDEIQKRGETLIKSGMNPLWTDLQILRQIDGKEIGNAISASAYSVELVENYLYHYKFKTWLIHSKDGRPVTDEEKKVRAKGIANLLCNHSIWKTHSRGISREVAWELCKLKIVHPETIRDLSRSIRRFWALSYWMFENTPVFKIFISQNYSLFRNDISLMDIKQ